MDVVSRKFPTEQEAQDWVNENKAVANVVSSTIKQLPDGQWEAIIEIEN